MQRVQSLGAKPSPEIRCWMCRKYDAAVLDVVAFVKKNTNVLWTKVSIVANADNPVVVVNTNTYDVHYASTTSSILLPPSVGKEGGFGFVTNLLRTTLSSHEHRTVRQQLEILDQVDETIYDRKNVLVVTGETADWCSALSSSRREQAGRDECVHLLLSARASARRTGMVQRMGRCRPGYTSLCCMSSTRSSSTIQDSRLSDR